MNGCSRAMEVQQQILKFITRTNWILFIMASMAGFLFTAPGFARGILFGGLLVTINFHLLSKTLKKAFRPPYIASHKAVLFKYYMRFIASGIIIFVLISNQIVHPLGLVLGLSVVVASIMLAAMWQLKKLILKEAV